MNPVNGSKRFCLQQVSNMSHLIIRPVLKLLTAGTPRIFKK